MSILQIKDLIHQYITYGEKEEETQTINAVNGVGYVGGKRGVHCHSWTQRLRQIFPGKTYQRTAAAHIRLCLFKGYGYKRP